ncbi:MAG TPA: hypothetical protein VHS34_13905 [Terriglobales bacterium]|nr:hypothetical protein [Terriglobales bacterium]
MNQNCEITLEIGGMPILLHMQNRSFRELLALRYAGFVGSSRTPRFEFDIELTAPLADDPDEDVRVQMHGGVWRLRRGDFRAQWDPRAGRGRIRQSANPYSIDSILRIVHTLILAQEGGFLLHSAGAIRDGKAFLFSGVSGAGKTTISRLAPRDVTLLTDEVSYVRRDGDGYRACGTPFAGELARVGENCSAPIECLFFLAQGPANRIETLSKAEAIRRLMRNILFFAEDSDLVQKVFQSACEFVERVAVRRLAFVPDSRVWEMIQ